MRACRQWTHSPHCGENSVTTWSPGRSERDALADRLDDARALVSEHASARSPDGSAPRGRVEVGVADAAGDEPHERLAGLRVGELELLDDEGLAELLQHGGAHLHSGSYG